MENYDLSRQSSMDEKNTRARKKYIRQSNLKNGSIYQQLSYYYRSCTVLSIYMYRL